MKVTVEAPDFAAWSIERQAEFCAALQALARVAAPTWRQAEEPRVPEAVCNVNPGCSAATPCDACRPFHEEPRLAARMAQCPNCLRECDRTDGGCTRCGWVEGVAGWVADQPATEAPAPSGAVHLARPGLRTVYCGRPLPGDTDLWTYSPASAGCAKCVSERVAEQLREEATAPAPAARKPPVRGPRNCGCAQRGRHRRSCPEAA